MGCKFQARVNIFGCRFYVNVNSWVQLLSKHEEDMLVSNLGQGEDISVSGLISGEGMLGADI